MRGAPHSGLSWLIVRINSRMSAGTAGLPTRRRDFHRQYRRKPLRCQRTSVSGLKTTAASSKEGNSRGAQAGEARLREVITAGGFRNVRRAAETPFKMILEARA